MFFKNRQEAGKKLVPLLLKYKNDSNVIVLGLPRGGVVLSLEVSKELSLPMDIIVSRKIGAPGNSEFAIGAITEDGEIFFNEETLSYLKMNEGYIQQEIDNQKEEALRRLNLYRGNRPPLKLENKIAILIDDGIATGATMRVSIKSARKKGAKKVVVAVPVIAKDSLEIIQHEADEVVYLDAPLSFGAVGAFYESFPQVEDNEVIRMMNEAPQTP